MSVHFSKWLLNSYAATPYFQGHIPADFPLGMVLIGSRTFHGLPPRIRELARLSKVWACHNYPAPAGIEGIEEWYDAEGYELDPDTGRRLSAQEVAVAWDDGNGGPAGLMGVDIPLPPGGFANPAKWKA